VRGDAALLAAIRPADGRNGAGEFLIPSRDRFVPGETALLEVSLGAHADEILMESVVTDVRIEPEGSTSIVTFQVLGVDAPRVEYVRAVLENRRPPSARRHRRVMADLPVRWWWGTRPFSQRAVGLSVGGTFVQSEEVPRVGFGTEVEIRMDSRTAPLRVPATIVWAGDPGCGPGFGLRFRPGSTEAAERLRLLVQEIDRVSHRDVVSLAPRR
jgi:hypothetical protein